MLLGTDVTFRAQPASTVKLLFNGVLLGNAEPAVPLPERIALRRQTHATVDAIV